MSNIFTIKIDIQNAAGLAAVDATEGAFEDLDVTAGVSFDSIASKVTGAAFAFNQIIDAAGMLADVLGKPLAKFSEFETRMANVESLGVDNIEALEDAVLDLTLSIPKTANELSESLYDVVSAGVDSANQISFLESTAKAATAGLADTTDAIGLGSAVIKGYGKDWAETDLILDQAFMTVKLGQTTFPELSQNIGDVAPNMAALNIATEEMFGSLATLTGVTGNTAKVSTQLKAITTGLMSPTKELTALAKKHGFASVEQMVKTKGLTGTLKILKDATGGSAAEMNKFFGSAEAVTALLALTGSQYDDFIKKTNSMKDATGEMDKAYQKNADTLENMGQIIENKVDKVLIKFGKTMAPLAIDFLDFASYIFDIDWDPFIIGAGTAATAIGAIGITTMIVNLGGLGPALAAAGAATISFSTTATVAITSIPIVGWIAGAVTALGVLSAALYFAGDDEAELAVERKKTAEATIAALNAEMERVEQYGISNGVTDETIEKTKTLNEQLLAQQKIINDANIKIYAAEMEDAADDLHDLHQGLIDSFDLTGKTLKGLFEDNGDDFIQMEEDVSMKMAAISDKLYNAKFNYIELGDDEREQLEKLRDSYTEIAEYLNKAADAQRKYNTEIDYSRQLREGTAEDKPTITGSVDAPSDVTAPEMDLGDMQPLTIRPFEIDFSFTDDYEIALEDLIILNDLYFENAMISEEDHYTKKIALLEEYAATLDKTNADELKEYYSVMSKKQKLEKKYDAEKKKRDQEQLTHAVSIGSSLVSAFVSDSETLFKIDQGKAIANAFINTYEGVTKTMAIYPYPANLIPAGLQLAAGLANVSKISSQTFKAALGGFLGDDFRTIQKGAYGGGEDLMIIANSGEYIINAEDTAKNLPILEAMNSGIDVKKSIMTPLELLQKQVADLTVEQVKMAGDITGVENSLTKSHDKLVNDLNHTKYFAWLMGWQNLKNYSPDGRYAEGGMVGNSSLIEYIKNFNVPPIPQRMAGGGVVGQGDAPESLSIGMGGISADALEEAIRNALDGATLKVESEQRIEAGDIFISWEEGKIEVEKGRVG